MNSAGRPLVLVIDDAIENIEVVEAALGEQYDISFATNGADGIDIAVSYPPDLILLDIMMPEMNGFETCRRLRANVTLCDVPVIFMSALDDVADKVSAFQSGGNDFVTKPFQSEEVQIRVATHIAFYRMRQELRDREESLRRNLAELESTNRQLVEMGSQLAQAEKQAAIGLLAAGVAHEINNPMGFISSNLTTLKRYVTRLLGLVDAYGEAEVELPAAMGTALAARREKIRLPFLREDIRNLIDESMSGAERVRIIVQNLRDFSRSFDEPLETVDLHELLDQVLASVSDEFKPSVKISTTYGTLPLIECMPNQICQALANLLRNALQSMPDGGNLNLRTECADNEVAIIIEDTGCGITPEIQRKIFNPFYTTKPVGMGTGMGLSVAHGIVTRHGGHITFASEPGKGSTFTAQLPIRYSALPSEPVL